MCLLLCILEKINVRTIHQHFLHFPSSWEGALNSFLLWAAREPYTFLLYVLIGLSPFLCISAILSYKLSKELKKQVNKRRLQCFN